jgi:hypothetical protein
MTLYMYVQNFFSILIKFGIEHFQTIALSKNDNDEHRNSENNNSFKDVKEVLPIFLQFTFNLHRFR